MNNSYQYLYEQSHRENFERQIIGGYLNESKIQTLINEDKLSEDQISIAEGLLGRTFDRAKGFLGSRNQEKGYNRDYERERIKGGSALQRHRSILLKNLDDYLNDLRVLDIATPEIEASIQNMKNEINRHVMDSSSGGSPSTTSSSSSQPLASELKGQWAKGPRGRFVPRQGSIVSPR